MTNLLALYATWFTLLAHLVAGFTAFVFMVNWCLGWAISNFRLYADFGRFLSARAKAQRSAEILAARPDMSDDGVVGE